MKADWCAAQELQSLSISSELRMADGTLCVYVHKMENSSTNASNKQNFHKFLSVSFTPCCSVAQSRLTLQPNELQHAKLPFDSPSDYKYIDSKY